MRIKADVIERLSSENVDDGRLFWVRQGELRMLELVAIMDSPSATDRANGDAMRELGGILDEWLAYLRSPRRATQTAEAPPTLEEDIRKALAYLFEQGFKWRALETERPDMAGIADWHVKCFFEHMIPTPCPPALAGRILDTFRTIIWPADAFAYFRGGLLRLIRCVLDGGGPGAAFDVNQPLGRGRVRLIHVAVCTQDIHLVAALLSRWHADLRARDDCGRTVKHYLAAIPKRYQSKAFRRYLRAEIEAVNNLASAAPASTATLH